MKTHDELGKQLRDARGELDAIVDCGTVHSFVTAAGEAYKGGVIGTVEYADALADAWKALRPACLSLRPKPTIDELEAILNGPDHDVTILPDGSVEVRDGKPLR